MSLYFQTQASLDRLANAVHTLYLLTLVAAALVGIYVIGTIMDKIFFSEEEEFGEKKESAITVEDFFDGEISDRQ